MSMVYMVYTYVCVCVCVCVSVSVVFVWAIYHCFTIVFNCNNLTEYRNFKVYQNANRDECKLDWHVNVQEMEIKSILHNYILLASRGCWICSNFYPGIVIRPIYVGKNQNPKNLGFFVVPFTLPEKPITFWFFGKKSACAKKTRISYWFFGKWCACATSLYLWPYIYSAQYVTGCGWFRRTQKVTSDVTKNPNNTVRGERAFTLAKKQ